MYETMSGTSSRLASFVPLGLPSNQDALATEKRQSATLEVLAKLAKSHVDPSACTFVVVGDASTIIPQLAAAGLKEPAIWTTEGEPASAAKPAAAKAAAPAAPKPSKP